MIVFRTGQFPTNAQELYDRQDLVKDQSPYAGLSQGVSELQLMVNLISDELQVRRPQVVVDKRISRYGGRYEWPGWNGRAKRPVLRMIDGTLPGAQEQQTHTWSVLHELAHHVDYEAHGLVGRWSNDSWHQESFVKAMDRVLTVWDPETAKLWKAEFRIETGG